MTDANYKNPKVIAIPNPVNLDKAIFNIQTILSGLPWIEKVFGRAKILPTSDIEGTQKLEPMVYQGTSEYYSVLPNDALRSYCFFRVNGYRDVSDEAYHETRLDLIFWVNLRSIDGSKDYIYTEELIKAVVDLLQNAPGVEVLKVIDEKAEEIFKGYSLNTKQRDLLYYPFEAFRIEMNVQFENNCQ